LGQLRCLSVHRFVQIVIQSKAPGLLGGEVGADDGSAEVQTNSAYWALFYHLKNICQWQTERIVIQRPIF